MYFWARNVIATAGRIWMVATAAICW